MIEKYLGVPYRHRGRAMDGLDCWGFLKLAYADIGVRLLILRIWNTARYGA